MKYIFTIIFIVVAGLCGYRYGYRVGAEEAATLKAADIAVNSIGAIDELMHNPDVNSQDLYEIQINNSLISYGEYLEESTFALPGFYTVKPVLENMFSTVRNYRKNNPRVRDGIEYSPSNKEYKKTAEYKKSPLKLKESFEKEKQFYNRAMGNI